MTTVEEINGRVRRERSYQILQAAALLAQHSYDTERAVVQAEMMLEMIEERMLGREV